jgi:protein farnesyltransferase/geranylgeranyltransferase type-1 subunit alpha
MSGTKDTFVVDISQEMNVLESKEWEDVDVIMLRKRRKPHAVHIDVDMAKQDVLNVFLDRMNDGEVSERMLRLTEEIILRINSADYSAWAWRWTCFLALFEEAKRQGNTQRQSELVLFEKQMMKTVVTGNPKNYQVWNYRRKMVELQGAACVKEEMEFTRGCLEFDAKNYHVWAHRQAVLKMWPTADSLRGEIMFTVECLERDVMNNSAWNQRMWLLHLCESVQQLAHLMPRSTEIELAMSCIEGCVENEAAWAYLKHLGLYDAVSQDQLDGFLECSASLMTRHETSIQPAIAVYEFYKVMLEHGESSSDEKTYSRAKVMMETLSHKLRLLDPLGAHRYSV